MGSLELLGVCSDIAFRFGVASKISCRALRHGLAVLVAVLGIFWASASFAQTVALEGNQGPEAPSLSARAAADRPLTVHVSFRLRNRKVLTELLSRSAGSDLAAISSMADAGAVQRQIRPHPG